MCGCETCRKYTVVNRPGCIGLAVVTARLCSYQREPFCSQMSYDNHARCACLDPVLLQHHAWFYTNCALPLHTLPCMRTRNHNKPRITHPTKIHLWWCTLHHKTLTSSMRQFRLSRAQENGCGPVQSTTRWPMPGCLRLLKRVALALTWVRD